MNNVTQTNDHHHHQIGDLAIEIELEEHYHHQPLSLSPSVEQFDEEEEDEEEEDDDDYIMSQSTLPLLQLMVPSTSGGHITSIATTIPTTITSSPSLSSSISPSLLSSLVSTSLLSPSPIASTTAAVTDFSSSSSHIVHHNDHHYHHFPQECIHRLSDDVLFHIFSFLAVRSDLLNLSMVNRRFYTVSSHDSLWRLCLSVPEERRKLRNFNVLYAESTKFENDFYSDDHFGVLSLKNNELHHHHHSSNMNNTVVLDDEYVNDGGSGIGVDGDEDEEDEDVDSNHHATVGQNRGGGGSSGSRSNNHHHYHRIGGGSGGSNGYRSGSRRLPILHVLNSKRELVEYKRRRWKHMVSIEYANRANDEIGRLTKDSANPITQLLILIVTCLLPCVLAGIFVLYGLLWDRRMSESLWFISMMSLLVLAVALNGLTTVLCAVHFGYVPCCVSFLLRYSFRNRSRRTLNFERFKAIFFREHANPLSNIHCLFFEPLTAWIWVLLFIVALKSYYLGERYVWSYVVIPVYVTMALGLMEPCFRSIHHRRDRYGHFPYCDPFYSLYHMLIIAVIWICAAIGIALVCAKLDHPFLYSWSVVLSAIYVPLMCISLASMALMAVTLKKRYFPNQESIILLLQPFACIVFTGSTFGFVMIVLLCLRLNGTIMVAFTSLLSALAIGVCCCSSMVCLSASLAARSSTFSRIFRQYLS